jgi:hypothetical protein
MGPLFRAQFFFFALAWFFAYPALAQRDTVIDNQFQLEQNIENISENASNPNLDYTNLLESLTYYRDNPINLNRTSPEVLRDLNLLSDVQIANLMDHMRRNGPLLVIYELQSLEEFELEDVRKILPYVRVEDRFQDLNMSWAELWKYGRHTLDVRTQRVLEEQVGYSPASDSLLQAKPNARYLGDPYKHFARYRFNYGNRVTASFTGEKDSGEEFFRGSQKQGFDFYSGYMGVKRWGRFQNLVVGDYHVQFGQGLTYWTDLAFGKSNDVLLFKRSARGIRAYNSLNENQYMRGAAATYRLWKGVELTGFFSAKWRDANVPLQDSTLSLSQDVFTAFQISGLHRTPAELQDRSSVRETVFGGNLSFKRRNLQVGLTYANLRYNRDFRRNLSLYNQYDFSASALQNMGIDYSYVWRNFNLYGEVARSSNGGIAYINGLIVYLDPKLVLSVVHRNYGRDYQSVYSRGFGETVGTQNEQGLTVGLNFRPLPVLSFSTYLDRARFDWLRFRVDGPSESTDWLAMMDFAPNKKTVFTLRYRTRLRQRNLTTEDALPVLGTIRQHNIRLNMVYPLNEWIRMKNRVELNYVNNNSWQRGFLFYHDVVIKLPKRGLSLTARYALFDVNGYDARVYALETDLPYAYSFPSFQGKGSRVYAIINYDVSRNLEFWLRIGQTFRQGVVPFSESDLEAINGPTRTDLKVQMRYKF